MYYGYIGSIVPWAGGFEPEDWFFCDGRLLQINQYPALASILGTRFGGNGQTTFALPNLSQKFLLGQGTSTVPNMPTINVGATGGTATGQLSGLPSHSHAFSGTVTATLSASIINGTQAAPTSATSAGVLTRITSSSTSSVAMYASTVTGPTDIGSLTVTPPIFDTTAGTGITGVPAPTAFSTLPPYQTLNYIIAVNGDYPMRP
ncbi:MAG: tail fiber protein [Rhodospirillaceae bacterium]|nr:tail fiber protein [Rhodospirillales bacterium]